MSLMKNLVCAIMCATVVSGCCSKVHKDRGNAHAVLNPPPLTKGNETRVEENGVQASDNVDRMESMVGKKLDVLIAEHGLPDSIESSRGYSVLFQSGEASVVLTYKSLGNRVYVTRDCRILGVVPVDAVER